jgi:hypothetical protein
VAGWIQKTARAICNATDAEVDAAIAEHEARYHKGDHEH